MLVVYSLVFILLFLVLTFTTGKYFNTTGDYKIFHKMNKNQAQLVFIFGVLFFLFVIWQIARWGKGLLPVAASEHGAEYDKLMKITMIIIFAVFVLTHIVLFYFVLKYYHRRNNKAAYVTHNTKLEIVWTVIPTVVLAILIYQGLYNWNSIMKPLTDKDQPVIVELYAKQFDWTARYAGTDKQLGRANFQLIKGANFLGLDSTDVSSQDDKIVKGEFHIPVGKPVQFVFRSQDVIHSAYMPHFRAQMNCVPGLKTQFNFVPTITTNEMRQNVKNAAFDYYLLCNKICGTAHYNMQMKIVVDTPEEYEKWLADQKTFQ